MIKAVTFDWWHTIVEPHGEDWEAFSRAMRIEGIEAVLRLYELDTAPAVLAKAYDDWTDALTDVWQENKDHTPEQQVLGYLSAAGLSDKATPELLQALEEPFGAPLVSRPPAMYTDFVEVASEMRRANIALGLVSNTGRTWGKFLRRVQREMGIDSLFDSLAFSDELGHRKPAPEIYTAALMSLGVVPQETVHVGDDPEADIRGAQAAGMRAVFYDKTGGTEADFADARIRSFSDLPEVLMRW
jgi:putative hydrolase of the HAD superfamily